VCALDFVFLRRFHLATSSKPSNARNLTKLKLVAEKSGCPISRHRFPRTGITPREPLSSFP
jgi:hypothetical protein